MIKKIFLLAFLILSILGCSDDKKVDDEVRNILKNNAENYLQSSYAKRSSGVSAAENTLLLVDDCFRKQLVTIPSIEDTISILEYAVINTHDKTSALGLIDCVSDGFEEEKIEVLFPIMRNSISAGNMTLFRLLFTKYYRDYRPKQEESFYLLEIAVEYCATDFITYLIKKEYPLNNKLWSEKKFKKFYSMVCEFDADTANKLDSYYKAHSLTITF